jgi:arabinogalactan oligomer/maltooligosaccharide transport system permease protein
MASKNKLKILFPTHIALLLVLPSLVLYVFFNTWPMVFSIGVALTNANRYNISPDPAKIKGYEEAIACASLLKEMPEYRDKASMLFDRLRIYFLNLSHALYRLNELINQSVDISKIPRDVIDELSYSTSRLYGLPGEVRKVFNCTELNYTTKEEIIPVVLLDKLDSLLSISGTIKDKLQYAQLFPEEVSISELRNLTSKANAILSEIESGFSKLAVGYDEYMSETIERFQREKDRLELRFVGIDNFAKLFNDARFYNALYKTLLFVAISVPLKVALGVSLAVFYSSNLILGRKAIRALLLVPWAMPFLLSALSWRIMFNPAEGPVARILGLNMGTNEWHAFLVYNLFEAWLAYPFIMTVTQGALRGVPKDVIEASYIDGASVFYRFRRIILPLVAKPLMVATILTTGASLQVFLIPIVLNGAGPTGAICIPFIGCTSGPLNEMLLILGYNKVASGTEGGEYGYAAAIYLVIVLIILAYVAVWFKISRRSGG